MSKRKHKRKLSPTVTLRPRLEHLWADEALLHRDDSALAGDLDVLRHGIEPRFLLRTMLRTYDAASPEVRARLDAVLPAWLRKHEYLSTLREIATDATPAAELRNPLQAWLAITGLEIQLAAADAPDLFYRALYLNDEERLGEQSQGFLAILWYTNQRKWQASGLGILLDYNPPWDGAVKDIMILPSRNPERLLKHLHSMHSKGDMKLRPISPEQAKTLMLKSLFCNQTSEIRLPLDLIKAKSEFEQWILALPDGPDTPEFTLEDFKRLAHNGKSPEAIVHYEQTVGHRIRLEDGKELLIIDPDQQNWGRGWE
ncbi:MAG: hypothetical protein K8R89_02235 [Anaerolineae bacterium]|nr:hypothetical protein [Anaerolineae bacterium]